jgi:hypothetical protein
MQKTNFSSLKKRSIKKLPSTSIGLKTNGMSREEILRALKAQKPSEFDVWDGVSEDDKPLTQKEMAEGLIAYEKLNLLISDKAATDNSDLPVEFVKNLMLAKAEDKSLATNFVPRAKSK